MYPVYDGVLTPGTVNGGPPAAPTNPIMVPLDQNIVSLDIYNMSPHRLQISVSGGQPDIYMGPNSSKEHVYIGRQAGASLNVATLKGHPTSIIIKSLIFTTGLGSFVGAFSIMGFREDEDWTDRKRPIVTGSINPVLGGNPTATQLVNQGNSQGTNVISTSSTPGAGSINLNNDGSGDIKLLDAGNVLSYIHLVDGTNLAAATAVFGNSADLPSTTFNGAANLGLTTIGQLTSAGGVACVGQWVTIAHQPGIHITTNGLQTVLTIASAPIDGTYRFNGYFSKGNATASAVTFEIAWTDRFIGGTFTRPFSADNASGTYIDFNGGTTVVSQFFPCFSIIVAASIGAPLTVSYNDPTGTPNDWITADIETFVI